MSDNTATKTPTVSVIMNCYNGEAYLEEALLSLKSQKFEDWELIFWDNRSTDRSREILLDNLDEKIKYFLSPDHTNLGEARRSALSKSTGQWVGFLDVDDLWHPNKLELQISALRNSPENVAIVYGRCAIFTEHEDGSNNRSKPIIVPRRRLPEGDISSKIIHGNFLPSPSVLYRNSAIKECQPIPSFEHAPDYYLTTRISQKYSVKAIDQVICFYRRHSVNLSLKKEREGRLEAINIALSVNSLEGSNSAHIARYIIFLLKKMELFDLFKFVRIQGIRAIFGAFFQLMKFKAFS